MIRGTCAFTIPRSKLRLKFLGSTAVPCRVVNTQPVSTHAPAARFWSACCWARRCLSAGYAQFGEGKRRFRGLGLDLAAQELVADPLDVLDDVELGGVEVYQFPGKPEDFTLAQAQDQDQHEGGVQSLLVMP